MEFLREGRFALAFSSIMVPKPSTPPKGMGLLPRILLLLIFGIALAGTVSTVLAGESMKSLASDIVQTLYGRFLDGASKRLATGVAITYGSLVLGDGTLLGDGGLDAGRTSQVVDVVTGEMSVAASVYARTPRGYVAIQTSFRDKEAKRSLGYLLDPASRVAGELDAGNEYDGLLSVSGERYTVSMEPLLDDSGKPIGALMVGQSLAAAEALLSESVSSALSRILAGTAMIVVMVGLFSFFSLRSSIAPLRHTVEVLGSIAAEGGDLTRRIESKRSDETGRLAFQFNTFIGRLRGEFAAVKEEASRLKNTATEVEREAAETTAAVARIGDGIEAVKNRVHEQGVAVEKSTGAVRQISSGISALDARIIEEARKIESSDMLIAAMAEDISATAQLVAELGERVDRLKDASAEGNAAIEAARESVSETASKTGAVLELNDLIGNVADRTRILAMNAAIEAAHAGEYGKGFAVVADEIRNLAEEAAARAAETATGLRGIQEATLRLTEASDQVGLAFSGIDESVEHTDSALQSIAGRMAAQRSGAEEAMARLRDVRESTEAITKGSAEMRQGSGLVLEEMRRLLGLSASIREAMARIAEDAAGIEAGARRAEESARRNTMGASALEAGLAHYVTDLPQEPGSIDLEP